MIRPTRLLTGPLDRLHRRPRRSRSGSVLILVVALLVLMALIGTAFLTSARTDRTASARNTDNTEVDLLAQGLIDATTEMLARNEYANTASGTAQFRPDVLNFPATVTTPVYNAANAWGYDDTDGLGTLPPATGSAATTDSTNLGMAMLAARVPTYNGGTPYWAFVSANPIAVAGTPFGTTPRSSDAAPTLRVKAYPTSIAITLPNGTIVNYPALKPNNGTAILAADTDGDGIADALLFPLYGPVNGIMYYGAVRVLDNGSAVNASLAMKPNTESVMKHLPGSVLPTEINLARLLGAGDSLDLLANYRYLGALKGGGTYLNSFKANPIADDGTTRSDVEFDGYEAPWFMLGTRMANPGYAASKTAYYRTLPVSDAVALARGFCVADLSGTQSIVEQALPSTVTAAHAGPYAANATAAWAANFNYAGASTPSLRPLIVPRNPVSTYAPGRFADKGVYKAGATYAFGDRVYLGGRTYLCLNPAAAVGIAPSSDANGSAVWALMPWTAHPTKISVNTGTFGQLWTAYWAVFGRHPSANPAGTLRWADGQRQFKNPIRDPNNISKLTFEQVRQLRAALAAVNTIDLRDGDTTLTSRTIQLCNQAGQVQYTATVFGAEPRPYITEAVVHAYTDGRPPYVAIELYNPHNTDITVKGKTDFKLAYCDRTNLTSLNLTEIPVDSWPNGGTFKAGTRWVIESDKSNRPTELKSISPAYLGQSSALTELPKQGTRELYLIGSRQNAQTTRTVAYDTYNESNLNDWAPLDQVNFTGILSPFFNVKATPPAVAEARWHIARDTKTSWHWVFQGPYYLDPKKYAASETCNMGWDRVVAAAGKSVVSNNGNDLGNAHAASGGVTSVPLQLCNQDQPGPFSTGKTAAASAHYPFGGFARPGDIIQVPFIGGYTIRAGSATSGAFIEMASVTMDSVFAEDSLTLDPTARDTTYDNKGENIGRFCPIYVANTPPAVPTDDWAPGDPYTSPNGAWRYNFAMDLFDYLDVHSPQDDYTPNVAPGNLGNDDSIVWKPTPVGVPNGPLLDYSKANFGNEDTAVEEGKININTAPAPVLACLNFCDDPTKNYTLAQAIVTYRDVQIASGKPPHGPFRNLFELMRVPGFATTVGSFGTGFNVQTSNASNADGDFSPFGGTDTVTQDFESEYLALTRISGMVTTRSDSFTGYVMVQGWRNAGTTSPELVVQRRLGFIADRSKVAPILDTTGASGAVETSQHTPITVVTFPN